jgi:hypothetical protein
LDSKASSSGNFICMLLHSSFWLLPHLPFSSGCSKRKAKGPTDLPTLMNISIKCKTNSTIKDNSSLSLKTFSKN